MAAYNYPGFSAEHYDLDNFDGPKPGQKAIDFQVTDLSGHSRKLLEFDGQFLVLELGSITCPLFQSRRGGMDKVAKKFPGIDFAVLYVREAHPGASIPSHDTMQQKTARARQLRETDGEGRQILIDGIDGAAHQAFGGYPNAVYIINHNGCVVYRSAWNNPAATGRALSKLVQNKPVAAEALFRPPLPPVAIRTLKHAGKGAVGDFLRSLPRLIWKNLIRRNLRLVMGGKDAIAPDAKC